MMEIVSDKYGYTYILRKGDKQAKYEINYKYYFVLNSMCNIDKYIKALLERELNKYECRNLYE